MQCREKPVGEQGSKAAIRGRAGGPPEQGHSLDSRKDQWAVNQCQFSQEDFDVREPGSTSLGRVCSDRQACIGWFE